MLDNNLSRFLNDAGLVTTWPKKHRDKELIVSYLALKFEFKKSYHEIEINEILKKWHSFGDWTLLRRELFERGYLDRNKDGIAYSRLK